MNILGTQVLETYLQHNFELLSVWYNSKTWMAYKIILSYLN